MPGPDDTLSVLQIGCGAFGETHLAAWRRLGRRERVVVADPLPAARARAERQGFRAAADWREALGQADLVDVVVSTDRHHEVVRAALDAGKAVFVEKPMAATAVEAEDLAERARALGLLLQVGMYFRFHPKAEWLKARIGDGTLGRLRYLRGDFLGFKRARNDSGALENDAVHFLDLFGWLVGRAPLDIHAVTRDHFGRGREDFALLTLRYPGGVLAHIEVGYIQPGSAPDTVVPNAFTTKSISVSGSAGAVEIDFQGERVVHHQIRHEQQDGLWVPVFGARLAPAVAAGRPVDVVAAELGAFVDCAKTGRPPLAGAADGLLLARILEAARRSALEGGFVPVA